MPGLLADAVEHPGITAARQPPLEMKRKVAEALARDEIHRWTRRQRAQHVVVQAPASLWKLRFAVAPPVGGGQFTLGHGVGFVSGRTGAARNARTRRLYAAAGRREPSIRLASRPAGRPRLQDCASGSESIAVSTQRTATAGPRANARGSAARPRAAPTGSPSGARPARDRSGAPPPRRRRCRGRTPRR